MSAVINKNVSDLMALTEEQINSESEFERNVLYTMCSSDDILPYAPLDAKEMSFKVEVSTEGELSDNLISNLMTVKNQLGSVSIDVFHNSKIDMEKLFKVTRLGGVDIALHPINDDGSSVAVDSCIDFFKKYADYFFDLDVDAHLYPITSYIEHILFSRLGGQKKGYTDDDLMSSYYGDVLPEKEMVDLKGKLELYLKDELEKRFGGSSNILANAIQKSADTVNDEVVKTKNHWVKNLDKIALDDEFRELYLSQVGFGKYDLAAMIFSCHSAVHIPFSSIFDLFDLVPKSLEKYSRIHDLCEETLNKSEIVGYVTKILLELFKVSPNEDEILQNQNQISSILYLLIKKTKASVQNSFGEDLFPEIEAELPNTLATNVISNLKLLPDHLKRTGRSPEEIEDHIFRNKDFALFFVSVLKRELFIEAKSGYLTHMDKMGFPESVILADKNTISLKDLDE